ncbi:MAG: hypothetical protein EOP36_12115 [Rubrivivax sp.]|nr:MAG: hypothetical protein EOP36_12115 [Rubrivivax sp.]
MSIFASPRFLSRVMWADAASCATTGALQLLFANGLSQSTGLPAALLTGTGLFLLAYALAAAGMASRARPPRTLISLVALGNVGWAAACAGLVFGADLPLTLPGQLWLGAQALVVLLLADLQWTGLRRSAQATQPIRAVTSPATRC